MTGSFLHRIPFPGIGITWNPIMIFHCFLVLPCFCLHCYYGKISLPRVVCVLGFVSPGVCNRKICHRGRLESLGNFMYPRGYCSLSYPKSLIIVHNRLTWGDTLTEISWWRCNHFPTFRSCLVPRVSWLCIFQIRCWDGCLKPSVAGFGGFILPLL